MQSKQSTSTNHLPNASDVAGGESDLIRKNSPWFKRLLRAMFFGKTPFGVYMSLNQVLWRGLPSSVRLSRPIHGYGRFLHRLVQRKGFRRQVHGTFFLRNRPQFELIRRIAGTRRKGDSLRVAVLGCSTGPEVYSVAWSIRAARPDLALVLTATDISEEAIETARLGVYSLASAKLGGTAVCEKMSALEMDKFFDRKEDAVSVKPWLRRGINWRVDDVSDRNIVGTIGLQDVVVANNFLCHMSQSQAETCLRNIVRVVKPGGYLIVSGIDLDVRAKVARDLGWEPMKELLEEIHEGDILRNDWPFRYFGLEPLDKRRQDWRFRYAAVFQIPLASPVREEIFVESA